MDYFLDTSALLKRYIPEDGTAFVDEVFAKETRAFISSLTLTEAVSVFRRLHELKGVITERDFTDLRTRLFADVADGVVEVLPLSMQDVITSTELLSLHYMTPVDALILAAAINLKQRTEDVTLVSADVKLCALAGANLPVINPADVSTPLDAV